MKFAVLDFETTGSQPADRIIQVGLVIIQDDYIIDRYTSLVNPGIGIPSSITSLTGIDDEMVKDAPELDTVIGQMVPLLQDTVLVGHNIAFDLAFLQRALDEHGYFPFDGKVLDTMDTLRVLFPYLGSLQLNMVCQSLGIEHERPHQADSDAEATALVWLRCLERLQSLPLLTLQRLSLIFDEVTSDLGWFLHEMKAYKEMFTSVDTEEGRYFRQFAINVDEWGNEEPVREDDEMQSIPDSFAEFYEWLKQQLQIRFESYEDREAQVKMLEEVEAAFEEGKHLMIEAGTGTGKSLGYLIPSLYYGLKKDKKVLVSTHTINLQEQIRERDIPLLHSLFPVGFRAAVLKGRSHYLCLRKFEHKMNLQDFENGKEDRITAGQMLVWLSETKQGDEEELHFATNKGNQFWHTVASDSDSCLNRACPWFKRCFYHRARHESNTADVIITNHSMLFTDTKAENRLLPSYKHLVIDEAHHFEEVASKHLGIELFYGAFLNTLWWLYKDGRSGQLSSLKARLQREESERAQAWSGVIDAVIPKIVAIKEQWDELAELLYQLLASRSDPSQTEGGQLVFRIKKDQTPSSWDKLLVLEENIYLNCSEVLKKLDKMLSEMKELQDEQDLQGVVTDIGGTVKELYRHRDNLHFFMTMPDDNYVYWLEGGQHNKSKSLQLVCVPIDVSPMLQQHFFEVKDSVIMTSATLSVGKSFGYTCEQLGLEEVKDGSVQAKLKTVQLPSPFNYRQQALVAIPRDFPSIRGNSGEKQFLDRLTQSLAEVALETKGRMLVLFTSNRMLKLTHAALKEVLSPFGIQVLGQGVDSSNRSKLTRLFQNSPASVLLGTSSFWEGVDIPGDALSCLAIVRLPFQPPNHPLVEAKTENLKKLNQNPFMKLSVPQAVIRFKQGFGRLVRTANDKGIVIIYDTRVIDTTYGKYFLYSLPGPKIEHMPTNQLVPRIKQWMGESDV
ncbi:ATP-dependent DNA helicase DinG [Paenibacillus doosanensis]|uniref:ATP-dependent DNA helicase DinG n=1 Tax=Paenibacillus doosanensis TaxID=1229154 RepID=UPI00217FC3A8|nr:ATP-dependent DNA helicase DinG [Paenibacillus doosanensis]MCS7462510.1 ATP-dependent DNA helicase DinG [Paenibacillus doosanensis]